MRVIDRAQSLAEGVLIALESIRSNKVRATLTILGIAVGVFVVTAMSAAVHGINAGVEKSLAAAGPTTFFVTKWPAQVNSCTGAADSCPWRRNPPLTVEDAEAIERQPYVRAVTAHITTSGSFKRGDRSLPSVTIEAYTAPWTEVTGGDIEPGRSFTAQEASDAASLVVINAVLAERLFGETEAVGKELSINGSPFRVIGVHHPVGNIFEGANKAKAVVPFETARRKLATDLRWVDLTVKPRPGVDQDEAMDDVTALLRARRGLKPAVENTFFLTTQEKILELYNKIVGAFFVVMLSLSAIGLLVGGVGVVAIMMISVTERTREIGVRKALGATKGVILWQFLVEAATLTTIGAVAGLLVGGALTWLIRSTTPIEAAIPPLAIVAALGTSALTGILFGLLPAIRAARLDPVEALRYE
jgi:putative ABC transport system permease protein